MHRKNHSQTNSWECYDAHLANAYLDNPGLFPSIDNISCKIILLLNHSDNRKDLETTLITTRSADKSLYEKLIDEFYKTSMFGKLDFVLPKIQTPIQLIDDILNALNNKKHNLPLIMHIHQVFMLYIFDNLPNKLINFHTNENPLTISQKIAQKLNKLSNLIEYNRQWSEIKKSMVKKIFNNKYFPSPRILSGQDGRAISTIDTSDASCAELSEVELHCSVVGVFSPIPNSDWLAEIHQYGLPFRSGPSGHSGSLLLLASLIGDFNEEQLAQYAAGAIAFLCGGGFHTIHEILAIFQIGGLAYAPGNYRLSMPSTFTNSSVYTSLQKRFPEHLQVDYNQSIQNKLKTFRSIPSNQYVPVSSSAILPNCSLKAIGLHAENKQFSSSLSASKMGGISISSSLFGTFLLATTLFRCCKRKPLDNSFEKPIHEKEEYKELKK